MSRQSRKKRNYFRNLFCEVLRLKYFRQALSSFWLLIHIGVLFLKIAVYFEDNRYHLNQYYRNILSKREGTSTKMAISRLILDGFSRNFVGCLRVIWAIVWNCKTPRTIFFPSNFPYEQEGPNTKMAVSRLILDGF